MEATDDATWNMDVEEPNPASVISKALNTPQEMASRTTELTAVAVPNGELIAQMGNEVSQRIAYQTA